MPDPITVSEVTNGEMLRAFITTSLAFQHNEPFWDVVYPLHWTEKGRKAAAERWVARNNTDPRLVILKAVDKNTGTIVGAAKWLIYHDSIPQLTQEVKGEMPQYDDPDEQAYCNAVVEAFMAPREEALKRTGGNLVSLDALAIDPTWQKRGAGDALTRWGVQKADELGVMAVVESTICGKRVYEKNGFRTIKHVVVEVPEKWQNRPKQVFDWMERPIQGRRPLEMR